MDGSMSTVCSAIHQSKQTRFLFERCAAHSSECAQDVLLLFSLVVCNPVHTFPVGNMALLNSEMFSLELFGKFWQSYPSPQ